MITAWSFTTEWKLSRAYSSLQIGSPNTGLLLGNYCERAMSSGSTTVVMNVSVISVVAAAMQSSFIVGSKKIIYAVFIVLESFQGDHLFEEQIETSPIEVFVKHG